MSQIEEFNDYRTKMNEKILSADNKVLKRLFNLDTNAYSEGAINLQTKEMIGLACSMVLRCDDCIKYHIQNCFIAGVSKEQVFEVFSISNIVGGTIVIPHLRRAVEFWELLEQQDD